MHKKQTLILISSFAVLACIGLVYAESVTPFSQYGQIQPVRNYSSSPFWNKDSPYNQRFPTPIYATGADLNTEDCNRIVATLVSSYCSSNNNCSGKRVSDVRPHIMKQLAELPGHSFATSCGGYIDSAVDNYQKTYGNMKPGMLTPKPTAFPNTISSTIATTVDNLLTPSASEYQRGVAKRAEELKQLQAQTGTTPTVTAANFPKTSADLPFTDRLKNIAAGFEPYKDKRAYQEIDVESEQAFAERLRKYNNAEFCRQYPNDKECETESENRRNATINEQPSQKKCRDILVGICKDGLDLLNPGAHNSMMEDLCRMYLAKKFITKSDGTPIYDNDGAPKTDPTVVLDTKFVIDYIKSKGSSYINTIKGNIQKYPSPTSPADDKSIFINWDGVAAEFGFSRLATNQCECSDKPHMDNGCNCVQYSPYVVIKNAAGMCECKNQMKIDDKCQCTDKDHMDANCNCKPVGNVKTRNDGGICVCKNGGDIDNDCQCSLTGVGVDPATCQCYDTNRMDADCNCKNNGTFDTSTHKCTCPITDSTIMNQATCECIGNKHYESSTGNCEDSGGVTPPTPSLEEAYIAWTCRIKDNFYSQVLPLRQANVNIVKSPRSSPTSWTNYCAQDTAKAILDEISNCIDCSTSHFGVIDAILSAQGISSGVRPGRALFVDKQSPYNTTVFSKEQVDSFIDKINEGITNVSSQCKSDKRAWYIFFDQLEDPRDTSSKIIPYKHICIGGQCTHGTVTKG